MLTPDFEVGRPWTCQPLGEVDESQGLWLGTLTEAQVEGALAPAINEQVLVDWFGGRKWHGAKLKHKKQRPHVQRALVRCGGDHAVGGMVRWAHLNALGSFVGFKSYTTA